MKALKFTFSFLPAVNLLNSDNFTIVRSLRSLFFLAVFFSVSLLSAQSGSVNFDGLFAPGFFVTQNTPADDYSDGFVNFVGDWEVLDCTDGNFGLTGFSVPNALKWNTSETGNLETISFISPVSNVSFNIGIPSVFYANGDITIEAFDASNNSLNVQNISVLGSALVPVTISVGNVSRIDITTVIPSSGCLDDIAYTVDAPIPTMSQWGLFILGLIMTSMAVVKIRKSMLAIA